MKITAKFRASRRLRFEGTKRIMSPEIRPKSFGTFEKQAPALIGYSIFTFEEKLFVIYNSLYWVFKFCLITMRESSRAFNFTAGHACLFHGERYLGEKERKTSSFFPLPNQFRHMKRHQGDEWRLNTPAL